MFFISHRGNTKGRNISLENNPMYVDLALFEGYDVEVDTWYVNGLLFLGHDQPDHLIDLNWFYDRKNKLWIHCKNVDSVTFFLGLKDDFNFFWHETDTMTLTSKSFIWAYPGKQPIKNSISVMPEMYNDILTDCIGICSDNISFYYDKNNNI